MTNLKECQKLRKRAPSIIEQEKDEALMGEERTFAKVVRFWRLLSPGCPTMPSLRSSKSLFKDEVALQLLGHLLASAMLFETSNSPAS